MKTQYVLKQLKVFGRQHLYTIYTHIIISQILHTHETEYYNRNFRLYKTNYEQNISHYLWLEHLLDSSKKLCNSGLSIDISPSYIIILDIGYIENRRSNDTNIRYNKVTGEISTFKLEWQSFLRSLFHAPMKNH